MGMLGKASLYFFVVDILPALYSTTFWWLLASVVNRAIARSTKRRRRGLLTAHSAEKDHGDLIQQVNDEDQDQNQLPHRP